MIDWHLVDDELHSHFNEQLRTMGAFLMGRVTYELMAGFWPTADTAAPRAYSGSVPERRSRDPQCVEPRHEPSLLL